MPPARLPPPMPRIFDLGYFSFVPPYSFDSCDRVSPSFRSNSGVVNVHCRKMIIDAVRVSWRNGRRGGTVLGHVSPIRISFKPGLSSTTRLALPFILNLLQFEHPLVPAKLGLKLRVVGATRPLVQLGAKPAHAPYLHGLS